MSFNVGSLIAAETRVARLSGGRGAGYFNLTVECELNLHARSEEDPYTFFAFEGELRVSGNGNAQYTVGRLASNGPNVFGTMSRPHPQQLFLNVELDLRRLEAIERIREGGGLRFLFTLWATLASRRGLQPVREQFWHEVNQGTWVEVLNQLGYGRTMLFEFPMPDDGLDPRFKEAVRHLANAKHQMEIGQWREAVGCCRDTLEALSTALGDGNIQAPPSKRDWDKRTRVWAVRRAVFELCHPARHADQVAARFECDRTDALSILLLTAAVLRETLVCI